MGSEMCNTEVVLKQQLSANMTFKYKIWWMMFIRTGFLFYNLFRICLFFICIVQLVCFNLCHNCWCVSPVFKNVFLYDHVSFPDKLTPHPHGENTNKPSSSKQISNKNPLNGWPRVEEILTDFKGFSVLSWIIKGRNNQSCSSNF